MDADAIEKTNLELWGLYNVQRSAQHNVYYYGARASRYGFWNTLFQLVASVLTLGAVTGLLALSTSPTGKWISAIVGAVAAICAAVPSVFGYADKIKSFERLHFCYCELFHLVKVLVLDIRRTGTLTPEQLGQARILHDLYSRLGQMDEADLSQKVRDEMDAKVRAEIPDSSLWYAGNSAGPETTAPTAATP